MNGRECLDFIYLCTLFLSPRLGSVAVRFRIKTGKRKKNTRKYSIHCFLHEQMNKICIANIFHSLHLKFYAFLNLVFRLASVLFRKCICNSSNIVREKPSKCSKLFNLVTGGRWSPCCMPCYASVSSVWDIKRMEIRTGTLWHVDK